MRSTNNPKLLKILDRELGLDRTAQGHIHAIDNTCIHRSAALTQGWIENDWSGCPNLQTTVSKYRSKPSASGL
jgi:phenylpropionate dioxygenase-like ring-hydroxylating dioxygenase large terminal subunit